ncbi:MAG: hypothetical protein NVV67_01550 [Pseudoxanthomonas sp.]|nr:hypothetical protein [Pseudoxanthomonas sp.]
MRRTIAAWAVAASVLPTTILAGPQEGGSESVLVEFAQEYAAVAGLSDLRTATVPAGTREIRIWTGFGLITPHHSIAITVRPAQPVEGRALNRFRYDPDDVEYMRELLDECASDPRYQQDIVICDAKLPRPVDWQSLYRKIEQLGIATLPDESLLPPANHRIHDGAAVLVEIATADGYRAYDYSNPMFRSEPEAQAALEIMRTVNGIFY